MARPSNAAVRRKQLTAALARLLPTTGFAGASTKAIAAEAGLSPGLLHHHFRSKQAILVAVVEELASTLARRLPADLPTPRAQVHAHLDAWLAPGEGADPSAVACWAAIGAEAVRQPEVAALYAATLAQQVESLTEALRAAAPHRAPAEAHALAALVHATIEGAFRLHASAPGTLPEGSAAPTLRRLVDDWLESP